MSDMFEWVVTKVIVIVGVTVWLGGILLAMVALGLASLGVLYGIGWLLS